MDVHTLLEADITNHVEFESEEKKQDFLIEFSDMFFERLLERAYEMLDDEADARLEKLVESNPTQTDIFIFLVENISEFAGIVGEEFLDHKEEALEVLQAVN